MKTKSLLFLVLTFAAILGSCSLLGDDSSGGGAVAVENIVINPDDLYMDINAVSSIDVTIEPKGATNELELSFGFINERSLARFAMNDLESNVVDAVGTGDTITLVAKSPGTAVLNVRAGGVTKTVNIEVSGNILDNNDPFMVPSDSISSVYVDASKELRVLLRNTNDALAALNTRWETSDSSIVSVVGNGNNALITGKAIGITKILAYNPLCTYPAEFLIEVKQNGVSEPYITSSKNVVALVTGTGHKEISVSLVGGEATDDSDFTWSTDNSLITLSQINNTAIIEGITPGETLLTVSHPKAQYDMNILVRTVNLVEGVFVDVNNAYIDISKGESFVLEARVEGYDGTVDPTQFTFECDNPDITMNISENKAQLYSDVSAEAEILVNHPLAYSPLPVYLLVRGNELGFYDDNSAYIYSSHAMVNVIIGGDPVDVNVQVYTEDSVLSDGFNVTTDGSNRYSHSLLNDNVLHIEGLVEGYATLYIDHPVAAKQFRLPVRVWPVGTDPATIEKLKAEIVSRDHNIYLTEGDAPFEAEIYLEGNGFTYLKKITNGDLITYEDRLGYSYPADGNGDPIVPAMFSDPAAGLSFTTSNNVLDVVQSGSILTIDPTTECQSYITITHPLADNSLRIFVKVSPPGGTLAYSEPYLTTTQNVVGVNVNGTKTIKVSLVDGAVGDEADIIWEKDNNFINITAAGGTCQINGVTASAPGDTTLTISHTRAAKDLVIKVVTVPEGESTDITYFTTTDNNLYLLAGEPGKAVDVQMVYPKVGTIEADTAWVSADLSTATVSGNGYTAQADGVTAGETEITVSHPDAYNSIAISTKVKAVDVNGNVIDEHMPKHISADTDTLILSLENPTDTLNVVLVGGDGSASENADFRWATSKPLGVQAIPNPEGNSASINGLQAGTAIITVSHPLAAYDKRINVIVTNTAAEAENVKYLSTTTNVVTLLDDQSPVNISVRMINGGIEDESGYRWEVDNPDIAGILFTGSTATLWGYQPGEAQVTVTHPNSFNALVINIVVRDSNAVASGCYLTVNKNIVTAGANGVPFIVTANLIGGAIVDQQNISWSTDRNDLISISDNGGSATITPSITGEALITVSHAKAAYSASILVIIEPKSPTADYFFDTATPIVTMKPSAGDKVVNVDLIGATITEAQQVQWEVSNPDVVGITFNGTQAVLTPKEEGIAYVTVKHVKASTDMDIVVRVSEYTTLEFGQETAVLYVGESTFVGLQVPSYEVTDDGLNYWVDNNEVLAVTGSRKNVQITGLKAGTAIVYAQAPSGAIAEMLVSVRGSGDSEIFISSYRNAYFMVAGGDFETLDATLNGGSAMEQLNLQWEIQGDGSVCTFIADNLTFTGPTATLIPKDVGVVTIKVSHALSDSDFYFYVEVKKEEIPLTLSNSYLSLTVGKSKELKISIAGGTNEDYDQVQWLVNGECVTVLGATQGSRVVSVYAETPGLATVTAMIDADNSQQCQISVADKDSLLLGSSKVKVEPNNTQFVTYKKTPVNSDLWISISEPDKVTATIVEGSDGEGEIAVTGLAETGQAVQVMITMQGQTTVVKTFSVEVGYVYTVEPYVTAIVEEPRDNFTVEARVYPADANVSVSSSDTSLFSATVTLIPGEETMRKITIAPKKEGDGYLTITNGPEEIMVPVTLKYDQVTVIPNYSRSKGDYSYINPSKMEIRIEDGEQLATSFSVAEPNVDATYNLSFDKVAAVGTPAAAVVNISGGVATFTSVDWVATDFAYTSHSNCWIFHSKCYAVYEQNHRYTNPSGILLGYLNVRVAHNGSTQLDRYPVFGRGQSCAATCAHPSSFVPIIVDSTIEVIHVDGNEDPFIGDWSGPNIRYHFGSDMRYWVTNTDANVFPVPTITQRGFYRVDGNNVATEARELYNPETAQLEAVASAAIVTPVYKYQFSGADSLYLENAVDISVFYDLNK